MSGLGHVCARWLLAIVMFWFFRTAFAAEVTVDLPQQDLKSALVDVSKTFDVQVLYSADLVEGLVSPPLHGRFTIDAALEQLLAETGLAFSHANPQTVLIVRQPQARVFHALEVTATRQLPAKGANGSRDVLATESSGRYAARGASVGSPAPQALKDVPRALSVIGQPQMQDEGLIELADAVSRLPGVAVEHSPGDTVAATVRGRPLEYFQIDGGAVLPFPLGGISADLSAYDRIELLRGPDGLGNGFAPASGILNLVRKRPLDHAQLVVDAHAGSWDDYGGMIDATAPLGWGGRLRGRAVVSGTDKDYFYDAGFLRRSALYGIVEADLSASTLVSAGVQAEHRDGTPWESSALPTDASGRPVDFPRHTSFVMPWNDDRSRSSDIFVTLEQTLGEHWRARLTADRWHFTRQEIPTLLGGTLDPQTGDGLLMLGIDRAFDADYTLADLKVTGGFDWRGLAQKLAFNVNYAVYDTKQHEGFPGFSDIRPINVFDFDRDAYPKPGFSSPLAVVGDQRLARYGASAVLMLTPWAPLQVISAYRWSLWADRSRLPPESAGLPTAVHQHQHGLSYLGLVYALTSRWSAYASWADAYAVNSETLTPDGRTAAPTVGDNYEAGFKYATADGRLNAAVALYRTARSNFPRQIEDDPPDVTCCYDNGGDSESHVEGLEAEISGALGSDWQLSASYSYADSGYRYTGGDPVLEDDDTRGTTLDTVTPRHAFRVWTVWTPVADRWRGMRLGGGVRAKSRIIDAVESGVTDGLRVRPGGYALVDLFASRQFLQHWQASLNLRNVFDHQYYAASDSADDFYGTPRSVVLSVRGQF